MPSLNRVFLMGNLTRDPEIRHTPNNNVAICQMGLAINRHYTDSDGQRQQDMTFVDTEAWGSTAEVIEQYLKKGTPFSSKGASSWTNGRTATDRTVPS